MGARREREFGRDKGGESIVGSDRSQTDGLKMDPTPVFSTKPVPRAPRAQPLFGRRRRACARASCPNEARQKRPFCPHAKPVRSARDQHDTRPTTLAWLAPSGCPHAPEPRATTGPGVLASPRQPRFETPLAWSRLRRSGSLSRSLRPSRSSSSTRAVTLRAPAPSPKTPPPSGPAPSGSSRAHRARRCSSTRPAIGAPRARSSCTCTRTVGTPSTSVR